MVCALVCMRTMIFFGYQQFLSKYKSSGKKRAQYVDRF